MKSSSLTTKLISLEKELESIDDRIASMSNRQHAKLDFPEMSWIKAKLGELATLLKSDKNRASTVLRKVVKKLHVSAIKPPGKKRGFARLTVQFDTRESLREAATKSGAKNGFEELRNPDQDEDLSPEFEIDLGAPTKMDSLGPLIAELRSRKVKWADICQQTGLGRGPAFVAWKRFVENSNGSPPNQ